VIESSLTCPNIGQVRADAHFPAHGESRRIPTMLCLRCGANTPDSARFCPQCGTSQDPSSPPDGLPSSRVVDPNAALHDMTHTAPASSRRPPSSGGWLSSSDSISHGRFSPGTVLDGRYRVIGLLGRGGMGEVYRADDLRLGQPVALKFLPDSVGDDPIRLAQFHNEVRTARQVSHPNICRVHDIGDIEGHIFLSMELVDGEDLATSLRRIGRFPEDMDAGDEERGPPISSRLFPRMCSSVADETVAPSTNRRDHFQLRSSI
jgi:ribosomal protein L40E